MISKEHLDKFKAIYKKHFGKDLDDQSALEKATSLMNLMRNIYKPMTKKEYEALQKRRMETRDYSDMEHSVFS